MRQTHRKVGLCIHTSTSPPREDPVSAPNEGDQAGREAPSASSHDSELATSTTQTSDLPSHVVE